jgi:hypothetical protein
LDWWILSPIIHGSLTAQSSPSLELLEKEKPIGDNARSQEIAIFVKFLLMDEIFPELQIVKFLLRFEQTGSPGS